MPQCQILCYSIFYPYCFRTVCWGHVSRPICFDSCCINRCPYASKDLTTLSNFNPATVWFERFLAAPARPLCVSFQSRNGLIWTRGDRLARSHPRQISIPQRSDLNSNMAQTSPRQWRDFNPATVWFEPHPLWRRRQNTTHFNPATVWFELLASDPVLAEVTYFNPATVWFERPMGGPIQWFHIYFNPATVWFEPRNHMVARWL